MKVSLVILTAWWSALLAPIEPVKPKVPSPVPVSPKVPSTHVAPLKPPPPPPPEQIDTSKLPKISQAPLFTWKPGNYSAESLKLPEVIPMEKFDGWHGGPNWPQLDHAVIVVTDNAKDPQRFMAFMVDLRDQRVAAIRDGDRHKHFASIGQTVPGDNNHQQAVPQSIMSLAGSGAVIILRPPVPPGPGGIPDDITRRILDASNIAGQAGLAIAGQLGRG